MYVRLIASRHIIFALRYIVSGAVMYQLSGGTMLLLVILILNNGPQCTTLETKTVQTNPPHRTPRLMVDHQDQRERIKKGIKSSMVQHILDSLRPVVTTPSSIYYVLPDKSAVSDSPTAALPRSQRVPRIKAVEQRQHQENTVRGRESASIGGRRRRLQHQQNWTKKSKGGVSNKYSALRDSGTSLETETIFATAETG